MQDFLDRRTFLQALIGQMFRFGLVGLVNAAIDAAVFFSTLAVLKSGVPSVHGDLALIFANTVAWIVAVSCSYLLNSRFTFGREHHELSIRAYFLFAFSQIGGFLAHSATLLLASKYFPLPIAKLFGIGVGFVVNFTLARVIVFRKA
jgi:putative flippase GtrA